MTDVLPSKLLSMDKASLIQFMIKKGNERKRDQCETTQKLTVDSEDRISPIIEELEKRIIVKQQKIEQITRQVKNLELEISGLDVAQQALKGKIGKREEQMHRSEQMVKKQKEELRNIQRLITPELVKQLYTLLENKNIPKIVTMVEALVGLLRSSEYCKSSDVQCYLQKHEGLMYKMQNIVYANIRDAVLTKHLETIKNITKSFVDSSTEDFLVCSPYAPFLAWASQFIIFCRQAQQLDKVQQQLRSLEKDMEEKVEKQTSIKNIVKSLNDEGFVQLFEREINEDMQRIETYKQLEGSVLAKAK